MCVCEGLCGISFVQTLDRSHAIELKTDNEFHHNVDFAAGTSRENFDDSIEFLLCGLLKSS